MIAPQVSAMLNTGLCADCTKLETDGEQLFMYRPAFGGNIMAQIVTPNTRPQFCTARYKVFSEPKPTEAPAGEVVPMEVPEELLVSAIEVLSTVEKPKDIDIAEAEVIVDASCTACADPAMNEKALDIMEGLQITVINR